MKTKTEICEDSKSFERFETFARKIVNVSKSEIDKREKEEKKRKEKAKKS